MNEYRTCYTCGRRGDGECPLTGLDHETCKGSESRPFWKPRGEVPCDLCVHHEGMDAGQCVHCDSSNSRFEAGSQQEQLKAFLDQQRNIDPVNHPPHYTAYPIEVKEIIQDVLTRAYGPDGYRAYCLGNEIKYRMRAGLKGDSTEDIGKAMKYKEFREALDEH